MSGNELVKHEANDVGSAAQDPSGTDLMRMSTNAAALCKQVVIAASVTIQGRKHVRVEGWQAIALAHGCVASAGDVTREPDGIKAIGTVRRLDGRIIATGEGFVGDDEKMWASRPMFARRAMAQTRAISRACRAAFAHVVVMMNAGLQTSPAEEIEGYEDERPRPTPTAPGKVVDASWSEARQADAALDMAQGAPPSADGIIDRINVAGAADKDDVLKAILAMPDGPAKNEARKAYGAKKWGA
jgi:hypothetical protein